MKRIAILTSTRAEYGLLKPLIENIYRDSTLELLLIVSGTHVSPAHGNTIDEIIEDGYPIADQISYLNTGGKQVDRAKEVGLFSILFAEALDRLQPDVLVLLGDRYEILGAAMVGTTMNIPIAHIAGGEQTEGAIDEQVRHALTKLAHLHFAEAATYANNIKQMGEEAWRIHNVGALGIENINSIKHMSEQDLYEDIGIDINEETLLVTYHPVTLELNQLEWQVDELISVLEDIPNSILITYPNADQGSEHIVRAIEAFAKTRANVKVVKSLGVKRYLNVMRLCGVVVGNSSSALIEAPYLKVPVVNIGNRQKGRLIADNIICTSNSKEEIKEGIEKALSRKFREECRNVSSLYGEGDTSKRIVEVLKTTIPDEKLIKKRLEWM